MYIYIYGYSMYIYIYIYTYGYMDISRVCTNLPKHMKTRRLLLSGAVLTHACVDFCMWRCIHTEVNLKTQVLPRGHWSLIATDRALQALDPGIYIHIHTYKHTQTSYTSIRTYMHIFAYITLWIHIYTFRHAAPSTGALFSHRDRRSCSSTRAWDSDTSGARGFEYARMHVRGLAADRSHLC